MKKVIKGNEIIIHYHSEFFPFKKSNNFSEEIRISIIYSNHEFFLIKDGLGFIFEIYNGSKEQGIANRIYGSLDFKHAQDLKYLSSLILNETFDEFKMKEQLENYFTTLLFS